MRGGSAVTTPSETCSYVRMETLAPRSLNRLCRRRCTMNLGRSAGIRDRLSVFDQSAYVDFG